MRTLVIAVVLIVATTVNAREPDATVTKAGEVLNEMTAAKLTRIPDALLADAEAVAVFPGVVKVGFVVGGERGHGVVLIRDEGGNWQVPRFMTITAGSVGWQVGASATDVILVFKTRKSVDNLLKGKFKIGADIAAAAGPVGRRAEAATDGQLQAEIYSYSRSRGLFAGASIDGAVIQVDADAERSYYLPGLDGKVMLPDSGTKFIGIVDTLCKPTNNPAEPNPLGQPQVVDQADAFRAQAVESYGQLARIVDDSWRQYFALPAEAYAAGGRPSADQVNRTLARYEQVLRDPRYARITERPEFLQARQSVADYARVLAETPPAIVPLPPPPGR
jgi:lipid-binding SYLF domain-containing protein